MGRLVADPRPLTANRRLAWLLGYWLFGLLLRVPVLAINRHMQAGARRELLLFMLKATLSVGLPALFVRWMLPNASLLEQLGLRKPPGQRTRPRLAALVAVGWLGLVFGVFKLLSQESVSLVPASVASAIWMIAHVTVEEIAFRGFILGWLAVDRPFWRANSFTALMFLSMHLPSWYASGLRVEIVPMATVLLALSLVLGWVRRLTGNVWLATALHVANNALSGW
jgi:membrane protease YdiL (CAAX protease family)